jgi:hypothetical protein
LLTTPPSGNTYLAKLILEIRIIQSTIFLEIQYQNNLQGPTITEHPLGIFTSVFMIGICFDLEGLNV